MSDRDARRQALRARRLALKNKKDKIAEVRERRQKKLDTKKVQRQRVQGDKFDAMADVDKFIRGVTEVKPQISMMEQEESPVQILEFVAPTGSNLNLVQGETVTISPKQAREMYTKSVQVSTRDIAEFMGVIDFNTPQEVQDSLNLSVFGSEKLAPYTGPDDITPETTEVQKKESEVAEDQKQGEEEEVESALQKAPLTKAIANVECMDSKTRKEVFQNSDFNRFFGRASMLVERCLALNQDYDIFVDFSQEDQTNREDDQRIDIKHKRTFALDDTQDRAVTCVSFSARNPELFLATYAAQEDSSLDQPDGLLLVWNVLLDNRPEYIFQCQSMITVAEFHPSNPQLVLGCTLSGQLMLWDMKQRKRTPVFRSKFISGHTQAIFAMNFMPSAAMAMEQILTVSHDAKICVWRDDMLSEPYEMEFKAEGDTRGASDELTTSCFSIPSRDHNVIVLGSDTGRLFSGFVYSDQNPQPCQELKAHSGPVTNIEFHPPMKKLRLNPDSLQLFLTSSFDWTVKLWDKKLNLELFCFDFMQDYVHDVRWSPVHPAVFACVDGLGRASIFNINNKDYGQPVVDKQVAECGICRLHWSPDGKSLIFGDANGNMHLYEVAEELYSATEDDVTEFQSKIQKLEKSQRQQREEEEAKEVQKQHQTARPRRTTNARS